MTLTPTTRPPTAEAAAAPAGRPGRRGLLPAGWIRVGRPAWWAELVLIIVGWVLYNDTRNAVPGQRDAALRRAGEVLGFEKHLHLSFEQWANHTADHTTWLIVGMNYYYATLYMVGLIGVLLWLYWRHPEQYRAARTALCVTSGSALLGFYFFALAPPRFLANAGFIDTVVKHHTWGSWASGSVDTVSNQYAAMPSIHVAWASWCGIVMFRLAKNQLVRALGVVFPLTTFAVIVCTGNHFEADAVAGATIAFLGFGVQRLLTGRPAFPPRG
ncbi:phosphatase PAP2 family protein [Kitasatospora acidiphila]|uniref:Phosphatase PAP2 family protein n=1 Tax=Kitasatospora acidiphila TaxID=2567942 RepID=A0A540WGB0_9ACTN|nr:phosphatase PAP2 family protein [Kitasatospora acidiphila]TQF08060.1 phosphatase PAP2 family protein [Kitasatospora acidiphila]